MEKRAWCRGLAMGVLASVAVCGGTVGAQELPSTDVDLDVPPISTPDLPSTPLPEPSLPAPSLPAPDLPPAPVPSVTVPELPSSPVPTPSLPSIGGSGSADGSGTGGGGSSAPTTTQTESSRAGGGGSGGGGASSGGGSVQGATTGAAASGRRAATRSSGSTARSGARHGAPPVTAAAERRLRAKVRRLAGCLAQVRDGERRVLVMRAGLGPRRALSRAQVSRRLELPMRRVRRLERRGLRRLERLADGGGCGSGTLAAGGAGGDAGAMKTSRLAAATTGSAATGHGPVALTEGEVARSDVKGELDSSPSIPPAALVPPPGDTRATDLSLLAVLVGVGLLAFAVRREFGK